MDIIQFRLIEGKAKFFLLKDVPEFPNLDDRTGLWYSETGGYKDPSNWYDEKLKLCELIAKEIDNPELIAVELFGKWCQLYNNFKELKHNDTLELPEGLNIDDGWKDHCTIDCEKKTQCLYYCEKGTETIHLIPKNDIEKGSGDDYPVTEYAKDEQIKKLQAFKDYVHNRLDDAGIDKCEGNECRISERLDIVLKEYHKKYDHRYKQMKSNLLKQWGCENIEDFVSRYDFKRIESFMDRLAWLSCEASLKNAMETVKWEDHFSMDLITKEENIIVK